MKLDEWQEQVLKWSKEKDETKKYLIICSGRQSGKSTIISIDAGDYAIDNPNKNIMIIASVERQALLLFEKVLAHIYSKNKTLIKTGKDRPTKHKLMLKNGTTIHCLPTGDSGYGIRGYTIDRLYADEAAFIAEEVWAAVTPMLVTTGGSIILLSTPFGTEGCFYRCFHHKNFKAIHDNTEDVAANRDLLRHPNGQPPNILADGSGVTGTQPHMYMVEEGGVMVNRGSGGAFAAVGAPVLSADSPKDRWVARLNYGTLGRLQVLG